MPDRLPSEWYQPQGMRAISYRCGHCDAYVASDKGWYMNNVDNNHVSVRVCPLCNRPTFFEPGQQYPGVPSGEAVKNLPAEIEALYNEARHCTAAGAHTAAVLTARKVLMHIAVDQKATPGQSFLDYVEYLASHGFVPPNGRGWVDRIRAKSNEANHEIVIMKQKDAEELLIFLGMLLKFIYELPSYIVQSPPSKP